MPEMSVSGITPVEALIRERIVREGAVSFHDVMEAALYHPEHGYYSNLRGFGASGDFITSPEQHPAFGWLLGRQALDVWEALDRPSPFKIVELGAGSGALAESLVCFLHDEADVPELVYTLDEKSPAMRAVQQARLTDSLFRWGGTDQPAHFIIANEVADALPIHRAVVRAGRLHEMLVTIDPDYDALTWIESSEPHAGIEAYFEALHYRPPEGSFADVCLDLEDWVKSLTRRLARGVALVIDYTASPPRDTLLTYYRHTLGSDPLVRLGQQDISAHVDLRTLVRFAISEGLKAGATAQRGLLFNLGFADLQRRLSGRADRHALARLVDPNGPGGQITAVFLVRALPDYTPVGATGRDSWPEPRRVPSLPPRAEADAFREMWRDAFARYDEEL